MNLKFRQKQEEIAPGLRSVPVLDQRRNTNYPRSFKEEKKTRRPGGSLSPLVVGLITWIVLPLCTYFAGNTALPGEPKLAQMTLQHGMVGAALLTLLFLTLERSLLRQRLNVSGVSLSHLVWTVLGAFWFYHEETQTGAFDPVSSEHVQSLEIFVWVWPYPCFLALALYAFFRTRIASPNPLDEL